MTGSVSDGIKDIKRDRELFVEDWYKINEEETARIRLEVENKCKELTPPESSNSELYPVSEILFYDTDNDNMKFLHYGVLIKDRVIDLHFLYDENDEIESVAARSRPLNDENIQERTKTTNSIGKSVYSPALAFEIGS